jgi:hypothetical protein
MPGDRPTADRPHPNWERVVLPVGEYPEGDGWGRFAGPRDGRLLWLRRGVVDGVLLRVTRAIHDVDCDQGPDCPEVLTIEGRYGRYAAAALTALEVPHAR